MANTGTFLFAHVAQHTLHLVYASLHPTCQNLRDWQRVSSRTMALTLALALPIGLFPYLTFWQQTSSNLFALYNNGSAESLAVDVARLALCVTIS